MKLGVSSYSFRKYILSEHCDYLRICDLAKEFGFEGIEFIDLDNKGFGITTDSMKTAKEIREHCEDIGLSVIAYTVGANFLAENIDAETERICRCVDVAKELGAKVLRHDAAFAIPSKPLYSWREAIDDMAPYIRKVTEYAEKQGVRTCTENHGHIFQAPERVEALIRKVNNKNYGWLVDIGNFLCVDCDPVKAVTIAAPYAFHVHAKDFLYKKGDVIKPSGFGRTAGGNHIRGTIIGHGVVPVANCVDILKNSGYDGWLSVEFEGMEECLPGIKAGLEYLKQLI